MLFHENANPSALNKSIVRRKLISLNLSLGTYEQFQDWIIDAARRLESRMICCANVHMIVEAKLDPDIANAVNSADIVTADGMPLVWALKDLYSINQERIAGMDLAASLLQKASNEGISVFFYGSTIQVLEQIRQKCKERFPMLQIAGMVSPPFRKTTQDEDAAIIENISSSGAGMVFVILGCPKQELWMAKMKGRIPAVMLGLGGALLVLAGCQTRAPHWMQKRGLEWAYRLMQEPRRLFKRYAVTNSLYIYYIWRQKVFPKC